MLEGKLTVFEEKSPSSIERYFQKSRELLKSLTWAIQNSSAI